LLVIELLLAERNRVLVFRPERKSAAVTVPLGWIALFRLFIRGLVASSLEVPKSSGFTTATLRDQQWIRGLRIAQERCGDGSCIAFGQLDFPLRVIAMSWMNYANVNCNNALPHSLPRYRFDPMPPQVIPCS
jgi:hypothetical protein